MSSLNDAYDAVMLVSFGGPEGPQDVLPFLENVLRGRNVPQPRMLEVAEHYHHFGGVSPLNAQNRALLAALVEQLHSRQLALPVYWGNRNWHPLLPDTLQQMADDGIRRALAFFTSPYSSYSSCRQYLENLQQARQIVGQQAPHIDKLRAYYNHPGFIEPMIQRVQQAMEELPAERHASVPVLFSAHSIPLSMASQCAYQSQLLEASHLVSQSLGLENWRLVYQSRSGPPQQPWLEPDICDVLQELGGAGGNQDVLVVPIGFISDHMEVIYDLDVEARQVCDQHGMHLIRAATVGAHPRFVQMIGELIAERLADQPQRLALGQHGPSHDVCPADCCLYGAVKASVVP